MTPPHIETIARAMKRAEINKTVGILSPASIDAHVDASWKTCIPAATLVWSLAIEEAAKRAENWSDAQHMAHDMRTGVFPKQTKVHDAIAAAIRALAVEG